MKMLITCSDARIESTDIVPLEKGGVFVLRNAGNLIPHADETPIGSEVATIELAVEGLGISEIILCGHTDCGAMKALIKHPGAPLPLPFLSAWLRHAERTQCIVDAIWMNASHDERLNYAVHANVMVQMENLLSHAFVRRRLNEGGLRIFTKIYDVVTKEVCPYLPTIIPKAQGL